MWDDLPAGLHLDSRTAVQLHTHSRDSLPHTNTDLYPCPHFHTACDPHSGECARIAGCGNIHLHTQPNCNRPSHNPIVAYCSTPGE